MKNEPLGNDLIDAWLSGQSSSVSRRAIGRAVAENPETAAALVEQARTETALRKHFAPSSLAGSTLTAMAARPRPVPSRWRWFAATAGVATAVFIAWPSAEPSTNQKKPVTSKTPREVRRLGPGDVTPAQQKVPSAPPENHSMEARLNQFWLNGSTLHRNIKLSVALQELTRSIQQTNVLKRPELESLRLEIQRPEGSQDDPDVIFSDRQFTAGKMLRLMAAQADAKISYQDSKVILTLRDPVPPEKGIIDTRKYPVDPAFLDVLRNLTQPVETLEAASSGETEKAAKASSGNMFSIVARLRRPSAEQGYDSGEGQVSGVARMSLGPGCWYDQAQGTVQVSLPPSQQERVARILEALSDSGGSGNIFMSWKFIEMPAGSSVTDQIMDDRGFQLFMRELSQSKGVDILTTPPVISSSGQVARITNEVSVALENGGTVADFTGFRIDMVPRFNGEVMVLEGTADIGNARAGAVEHTMVDISATLQDNQTAVFLFPAAQPGRQIIGTVTARPVSAAGEPASGDSPPPSDPPGK